MAEAGPRVPHLGRTFPRIHEERGSDTRVTGSEAQAIGRFERSYEGRRHW